MWFLLLLLYTAHVELVITQGEDRIYLNGTNPCEGHIEVYHNGKWGFVGDQLWDKDTEEVVCKSTHCGKGKDSPKKTVLWPIEKPGLNNLNCNEQSKNLWDCSHAGWDNYNAGHLRYIQCSNKIKIALDGHRCSGAVKYSIDDGKTYSGYFCDDGWGAAETAVLCKNTNCGGSTPKKPQLEPEVVTRFKNSEKKMKVKCSGITNPAHLWQCVTEELQSCQNPASVICTDYERLQLKGNQSNVCSGQLQKENESHDWDPVKERQIDADQLCKQMHCGVSRSLINGSGIQLDCSDNVKVVLKDKNKLSNCYGEVHVEVNNKSQPVCASTWKDKDAQVVCEELKCGKVVSSEKKTRRTQGIMDDVKCSGKESSLWHCEAKHHNNLMCSSIAYVVCAGSVKVNLTDGPGRCAGRVEIQHEGQWRRIIKNRQDWTDLNSNVVCKEMGCGETGKAEKFSQGSNEFLTKTVKCKTTSKNISECLEGNSNQPVTGQNQEAMGIICEEHKVVILKGETACSGMVGIVQGTETFWLSGSNETWNNESANTVCQQMQCGEAENFASVDANMRKRIWTESYNCSSISASLFDCEKKTSLPSNHNKSIAFVSCSGEIKMNLTRRCWGTVNICVGTKCGGVCDDTWTTEKSEMLCKTLGCGDRNLTAISKPPRSEVIFKSLHSTEETTNLTQCNFVRNDKNDIDCKPAFVVCSGSVESKMSVSRDKCSGQVKVLFEDKELPVCKDALEDSKTQKAFCQERGCGQTGKPIDYFGPKSVETHVISKIDCPDNSGSLTACQITTSERPCPLGGLQCSDWRKIALTAGDKACSGDVSVVLEGGKKIPVSINGWTGEAGDRLCRDLDCGSLKSNTTKTLTSTLATDFRCAGVKDPENIWECKNNALSFPEKEVEHLSIECQDEPTINLSKSCHGEVMIDGIEVCSSNWNHRYSQLVCQQGCGNAIIGVPNAKKVDSNKDYYHVSCEDNHYELGQCKRFKGKCVKELVSVYCTKQIEFNTTKPCGGQILIKYRGDWENVCPLTSFPKEFKNKLCADSGCGVYKSDIQTTKNKKKVTLNTKLDCRKETNDIKYCVQYDKCLDIPAEIYCEDYVDKLPPPTPPPPPSPIMAIILGVGFSLVLVILIVVFIRIYIVKKGKKGMNVSSRMLSRQEVEFESGDYEDVTNKENEMEDLSRGRFIPESEVITENDAQSASSLPYDDIDDMLEAQPLTSQAVTAGAPGDNYMREDAFNQSEDGVTYEVEDPQENYDDIEAGPEITQTEAEIHKIPETAPESATAPPPELVEGDDDYLVPGVDG